jgi:hypothetical protein
MPIGNSTPLDDLLAAPVRAIGVAQQALESANIEHLTALMHPAEDGSYHPRTIDFVIGHPGEEPRRISLPLIALISLPQMLIDEAAISLNAGMSYHLKPQSKSKQKSGTKNMPTPPSQLLCTLLPADLKNNRKQGPSLKISLKVQRSPANEAIRQLQDRLFNNADPGS